MHLLITLFQLHSFCCVVDEGSFRSAAEKLFVSQPSVSQHIASLETHFSVTLFNRQKRKIRLTPEGRLLYSAAKEILDRLQDVESRISSLQSLEKGTLMIGCSDYAGTAIIPAVTGRFALSFPSINISVATGNWRDLEGRLIRNEIELVVHERKLDENMNPDILSHSIGTEDLVFVASHLLPIKSDPLSPGDVEALPLISYSRGNSLNTYLNDYAMRRQVHFRSRVEAGSMEMAGHLAACGVGVALVTRSFAADTRYFHSLRILDMTGEPPASIERLAMYHRTQGLTYAGWEMLKLLENRATG